MTEDKFFDSGISIFPVMSALANEYGAINLAQGFPGFDVDKSLIDLVSYYMLQGYNQYSPMPGVARLREVLSAKQEYLYHTHYSPDREITITAGATEAIFTAISTVVNAGDEVIYFEPVFDIYPPAIRLNKGIGVPVKLKYPGFEYDWEEVKSKITSKTKLIIINSPHNPTGKILKETDLTALASLVKNTDIKIISDEVYEHIVFDNNAHFSLAAYPDLKERSFIIASLGKVLHCTGWRIGYCLAPENLTAAYRKIHQFVTFSANTAIQYAMADYLENRESYLTLSSFFQDKRNLLAGKLRELNFDLTLSEGSYFQTAGYSRLSVMSDVDFAKHLTKEIGVATIPLSVFYKDKTDNKLLRFCFAKHDNELAEATDRIRKL